MTGKIQHCGECWQFVAVFLVSCMIGGMHARTIDWMPDSLGSAEVAQNICDQGLIATRLSFCVIGDGTRTYEPGLTAFTLQPPGYPLLLSLIGGIDHRKAIEQWTRIAAILLCGVIGSLCYGCCRRLTIPPLLAGAVVALALLNPVCRKICYIPGSDLYFHTLFLGVMFLLIGNDPQMHQRSPRNAMRGVAEWGTWVVASLLAAVALMLRYPGWVFVGVFLIDTIRFLPRCGLAYAAARLTGTFSLLIPVALWIVWRNIELSGSWTGYGRPEHPWIIFETNYLRAILMQFGALLTTNIEPLCLDGSVAMILQKGMQNSLRLYCYLAAWGIAALLGTIALIDYLYRTVSGKQPPLPRDVPLGAILFLVASLIGLFLLYISVYARAAFPTMMERRYFVPFQPFEWILLLPLLWYFGVRLLNRLVIATIIAASVYTACVIPVTPYLTLEPTACDLWLRQNAPRSSVIMADDTTALRLLVSENDFRCYAYAPQNQSYVFPIELRDEAGFLQYLRDREVRFLVVGNLYENFGRKPEQYFGGFFCDLHKPGNLWAAWEVYRDTRYVVFDMRGGMLNDTTSRSTQSTP